MRGFVAEVLAPIAAMFAVLILFICAFVAPLSYAECHAKWSSSGMQVDWGFFSGCRVSDDGIDWTPEDAFKSVETR